MSKPVITFVFTVLRNWLLLYMPYTCPNLWLRSCSQCHAIDCFCTYLTHVQTCDYVSGHSATQLTASVHTLHVPKPVITFVFTVLRNWLLLYRPYTHVQICHYVCVHSATQLTASVRTLNMSKPVSTFVFTAPRQCRPHTCPNLWLRSCSQCYAIDCICTYLTHVQTCDYVGAEKIHGVRVSNFDPFNSQTPKE